MYWPRDTLLVSNLAREAKRVAHPCSIRNKFENYIEIQSQKDNIWQKNLQDLIQLTD